MYRSFRNFSSNSLLPGYSPGIWLIPMLSDTGRYWLLPTLCLNGNLCNYTFVLTFRLEAFAADLVSDDTVSLQNEVDSGHAAVGV